MKLERKNDLSLRLLEVFDAVMRRRTTVDAAEDLGVSQPAVSNAVKALEKQIGVNLFERGARRMTPTEEAWRLQRQIEPLFSLVNNIETELRGLRAGRSGRLKLIATPPLGHGALPAALTRFLADREGVEVSYDIRRLETVIQNVEIGQAELGFALGVTRHATLEVTALAEERMVAVLPNGHPLTDRAEISPRDITEHRLIGLETSLGAAIRHAFAAAEVPYQANVQVRYCHTACVLAAAGVGVAVVDPWSARFLQSSNITVRPFLPSTSVSATVLHRRDTPWTPLAAGFVAELEPLFAIGSAAEE
ncbi:MAG: LysR family transcriptional regulator [Rhodobacteraceae bacterium]|nr:LysR family transcriptional regulator [Paracoccaceae bacterium]